MPLELFSVVQCSNPSVEPLPERLRLIRDEAPPDPVLIHRSGFADTTGASRRGQISSTRKPFPVAEAYGLTVSRIVAKRALCEVVNVVAWCFRS